MNYKQIAKRILLRLFKIAKITTLLFQVQSNRFLLLSSLNPCLSEFILSSHIEGRLLLFSFGLFLSLQLLFGDSVYQQLKVASNNENNGRIYVLKTDVEQLI